MGGACVCWGSFIVCFPADLGSGHVPRSYGHCLLTLKLSFGQQEKHGLDHALVVLIPMQTMWEHEIISCHTSLSTIKYLGSDYFNVDLIEQKQ